MSIESSGEELKKVFSFDGEIYDDTPAVVISSSLMATYAADMAKCMQSIIASEGSEHVHELRVILRRMRSVVSGTPLVFSEHDTGRLIEMLSSVVSYTGATRDTDILITAVESYFEELPTCFEDGKKGVMSLLRRRGINKRRSLRNYLKGKEFVAVYDEMCHMFVDYYNGAQEDQAPDGLPINEFAYERIMERFARILDFVDNNGELDDALIHKLRILCKKLRYNLEAFGHLSGIKKTGKIIDRLREIQDVLGFYNDLSVQQAILQELSSSVEGKELAALASVMTIMEALKDELTEEIEYIYRLMVKKDKLFEIKKKRIKKYILECGSQESTEDDDDID